MTILHRSSLKGCMTDYTPLWHNLITTHLLLTWACQWPMTALVKVNIWLGSLNCFNIIFWLRLYKSYSCNDKISNWWIIPGRPSEDLIVLKFWKSRLPSPCIFFFLPLEYVRRYMIHVCLCVWTPEINLRLLFSRVFVQVTWSSLIHASLAGQRAPELGSQVHA